MCVKLNLMMKLSIFQYRRNQKACKKKQVIKIGKTHYLNSAWLVPYHTIFIICYVLFIVAIPCANTLQLTIDFCLISPILKIDFLEFHIQQHRANQIRYWNTFRLFAQAWKEQHSCEKIPIQTKDCIWKGNPCCTVLRIFSDKVKTFSWEKKQNQLWH